MSFTQIGFHNLIRPDFNALLFSLMGMAMVFGGLLIIAIYIALLPRMLQIRRPGKQTKKSETKQQSVKEEEILLAIAAALHMHNNFPDGTERITWKSHGDMESPWLVSGRMHGLNSRKLANSWRRL